MKQAALNLPHSFAMAAQASALQLLEVVLSLESAAKALKHGSRHQVGSSTQRGESADE